MILHRQWIYEKNLLDDSTQTIDLSRRPIARLIVGSDGKSGSGRTCVGGK